MTRFIVSEINRAARTSYPVGVYASASEAAAAAWDVTQQWDSAVFRSVKELLAGLLPGDDPALVPGSTRYAPSALVSLSD